MSLTKIDHTPPRHLVKEPKPKRPAVVELNGDSLPFCCGITVLGEANCESGNDDYVSGLAEALLGGNNGGLLLYTTNQDQVDEREALAKAGFMVVADFINPNTGSNVHLHAKIINQPKPRARRVRRRRPSGRRR